MSTNVKKILILVGFVSLLFIGAGLMYTTFLKGKKKVDPQSIKPRTTENPRFVDSLKRAGFYGEENIPKK